MGRIRLQVVIAFLAILLLVVSMGYFAFRVTTVTVPDYGGTYVEGVAGNPFAINPLLAQKNPVDQDVASLVFNGLTRANEEGEIVPDLAERWEVSADGTEYTFYLRQDIRWHDGAPFTANDVVFTVNVMQNPDFRDAPFLSSLWSSIVVEQIDTYRVRFILREPFAPFLDYTTIGLLPVHILGSVPVERLAESKFSASPVGTGPFAVAEVGARRLALEANPNYYRSRPYLDRIEFIFYPNLPAVFEARKQGEISGISRVLPEHLQVVREDESLDVYSAPLSGFNLVFLNLDRGIFQERTVRQAMMWALDRQALVDEVLGGQGVVIHSPILPHSWAYNSDVQKYAHDPAKAREILEQGGWTDEDGDGVRERGPLRLEFTLTTNEDDPTRVRLVQEISAQLAEVGVLAIPEAVRWDDLVGEYLRLRRFDAVLSGWQNLPPDPDPYPYWHSSQAKEEGSNFANYISEEADLLLQDARLTNDRARRAELYGRFQELYALDVPSLLLYQPVYNYAIEATVQNVQVGPMMEAADRFATIRDWYIVTQRMLYREARQKGLPVNPR